MARRIKQVTYRPDRRGFAKFMKSDEVRDAAVAAAHDVADAAKAMAPRDTGAYAESFKVNEQAGFVTINGTPRAIAEVYNDDPAAAPVEFGGERNEPQRILGRAAGTVGDVPGEPG